MHCGITPRSAPSAFSSLVLRSTSTLITRSPLSMMWITLTPMSSILRWNLFVKDLHPNFYYIVPGAQDTKSSGLLCFPLADYSLVGQEVPGF